MATTTTTVTMPIYAVGDAGYRLWGKAWHDAMVAAGCTQVFSDIDLDTMIMPTTTGTMVAGSRIYSFDDSLHATHPLFVKLEWGRGSSVGPTIGFQLKISLGWQHDSGTLSGDVFSQFFSTHRELTEVGEIIVTRYDAGFSLWTNTVSTSTAGFLIERTSLNGTVVGDGVSQLVFGTDVNAYSATGLKAAGRCADHLVHNVWSSNALSGYDAPIMAAYSQTPDADGKIPLYPIYPYGSYDPLRGVVGVSAAAVSANKRFTGSFNGVDGTYRTVPGSYSELGNGNRLTFLVEDV